MQKIVGNAKEDRVAECQIGNFGMWRSSVASLDLQEAAVVRLWTHVKGERGDAIVHEVRMPGVVVSGLGAHAVNPTAEPCEGIAAADLAHEREERRPVRHELKQFNRRV